jgi:hypothetical protein
LFLSLKNYSENQGLQRYDLTIGESYSAGFQGVRLMCWRGVVIDRGY